MEIQESLPEFNKFPSLASVSTGNLTSVGNASKAPLGRSAVPLLESAVRYATVKGSIHNAR